MTMGEVEVDQVLVLEESPEACMQVVENGQIATVVYTIKQVEPTIEEAVENGETEMEHENEDAEREEDFSTTDPALLLKSLSPKLGNNGEIKDVSEVTSIVELMKGAEKLVTKCVYSNILRATMDTAVLNTFVAEGGWDVLNSWLQEAKTDANDAFLRELLKVYSQIPITVNLLKQNACAKTIKQISKSDNSGLKTLAAEIVDRWMSTVRQTSGDSSSSSDKSKKRKHSHKEKDNHKEKDSRDKDKKSSSSSSKDSKSSPDHKDKLRSSPERDATPFINNTVSSKPESSKPRAKTVKTVPTKFRSTGLEQESVLPPTRKKGSAEKDVKSNPLKRPSVQVPKSTPPEKKARPALPSPLPATNPIDKKGGVKFIQPRPKPIQVYESAGFMDALTTTSITSPGMRRKRKGSGGSNKPPTPTSPPGSKQPSVPSFYQETLENTEDDREQAASENSETSESSTTEPLEMEGTPKSDTAEEVIAEPIPPKKPKKKVSWAEEAQLKQFYYFELDETERVNVNRQKDFASSIKDEMRMERQNLESAKRQQAAPELLGGINWRRPRPISGLQQTVVRGSNSTERDLQKQREQGVLQALFFSKSMIPDTPKEADPEAYEPMDPKPIPLEDETGGAGEMVYTDYPKPVETVEPPLSASHMPAGNARLSLPPDIANLVASMAQQSQMGTNTVSLSDYQAQQTQLLQAQQNGAYAAQYAQAGMGVPPPQDGAHALAMAHQNFANYGHPPPGPHDLPPPPGPYGAPPPGHPQGPPPYMPGMRPHDDDWNDGMHGGPIMGPGPRGPPPPGGYRNYRGHPRGPPRGGRGMSQGPRMCRHFLRGGCRFEKNCAYVHPQNRPPV